MSKLKKYSISYLIIACFVISVLVVSLVFVGLGSTKNDRLESQNMALQSENTQLQQQIVALQQEVKTAEQKKARLTKRVIRLEVNFWDQKSQISELQARVSDLRRGLPFWEANYDMMVAQNAGHQYRNWPFDLREQLIGSLGAMAQLGPEGHAAASWRFATLKTQVKSAVKAGFGYGWESQVLADFEATL